MIYNISMSYILKNNKVTMEELHLWSLASFYYVALCVFGQYLYSELIS